MQSRLTIFLLVYWSLLINFAPSLHVHSTFGLHECCDHAAAITSTDTGCCENLTCCDNHGADPANDFPAHNNSSDEDATISATHSCSLCEFFKYLNFSVTDSVQLTTCQPVDFVVPSLDESTTSISVSSRARGPPAVA